MVSTAGAFEPCATATLLSALTAGLAGVREPRLVRERFEEELRALVSAESVTFCEGGSGGERPNVVSCDLPATGRDAPPRLEAVFHPRRPADDRARAMMSAAAHVAGLLLEIERASGRWPLSSSRGRADGAAPIIGSSLPMRRVRERIERVAATDFTILIEGGFGPQPHPGFVEVLCATAFGRATREVAGAGEDRERLRLDALSPRLAAKDVILSKTPRNEYCPTEIVAGCPFSGSPAPRSSSTARSRSCIGVGTCRVLGHRCCRTLFPLSVC